MNISGKLPAPGALAGEVQRQVDARLRVYAGPERDVVEADGARVYRQRYFGGWKDIEGEGAEYW